MFNRIILTALLALALAGSQAGGRETDQNAGGEQERPVTLISPNGGEQFTMGTELTISWRFSGQMPDRLEIRLSMDSGKHYNILLATLDKSRMPEKWVWEDVRPASRHLRVQLVVYYKEFVAEAHSFKDFSVVPLEVERYGHKVPQQGNDLPDPGRRIERDVIGPQLILVTPNGGEVFTVGSEQTIKWECKADVKEYRVYLSTDGGLSYPIPLSKPLPGDANYFEWKVGSHSGERCRVKVVAKLKNATINDASDHVFAIHHPISEPADDEIQVESGNSATLLPTDVSLNQNYPNPFNPSTKITFDLSEAAKVSLRAFNLLGQEVATLVDGPMTAGHYEVTFDGRALPSGLYLYRLESSGMSQVRTMLLAK